MGRLAKTDPLDPRWLAHFAEAVRPTARALPDPLTETLSQLLVRRRQLVEMLVAERNRQHAALGAARQDIDATIQFLEERLERLDQAMFQVAGTAPEWQEKFTLLRSVPGIGPVVTHTLLAELPELGRLSGKQAAVLAGVAPYNRDSEKLRGQRHIYGGGSHLRTTL